MPLAAHGPVWQAAAATSGPEGAMLRQQIWPPSQFSLEMQPTETQPAASPGHVASEDGSGAAS